MDAQRILETAIGVFKDKPNWAKLFRDVFGPEGIVNEECQTVSDLSSFESSLEFRQVQEMIAQLRCNKKESDEPTRVITIRIPETLHICLREESHRYRTSMNQLAISKLLQGIHPDYVPSDTPTNHSASRPNV